VEADVTRDLGVSRSSVREAFRRLENNRFIRIGETSPDALAEKLRFALGDLESRLTALGLRWSDATQTRLYTAHVLSTVQEELAARGASAEGVGWHCVRPPIRDREIEVDARRTSCEKLLAAG
jgi:DNA-binding FadR family transcriptional regulator